MSEEQSNPKDQAPAGDHSIPRHRAMRGRTALLLVVAGLIVAALIVVLGVVPRLHARKQLTQTTDANAAPTVTVAKPTHGQPEDTLTLPGALQAYIDSPIYARTSGYLGHWYFDIGAHVRQGQLLATIESPEVDQELAQAQAQLATAQANARNAAVQAARYKSLLNQNAVSQQDTDNFVTQQIAGNTQVQAAQANVGRLQQLVGFEKIYAPFTGVITARDIDNGQLINAGSTNTQRLFEEAQTGVLRTYVAVPQVDSGDMKRGLAAQLSLAQYPARTFTGHVVRTSDAINPSTRTLLVEVDVPNPHGELLPGSFGQVTFHLHAPTDTLLLPVPTLIFQSQGLQVATVVHGKVKLLPVTAGQSDGKVIQIVSGLTPNDEVIQNPPDALLNGEPVRIVQPHTHNGQAQPANEKQS